MKSNKIFKRLPTIPEFPQEGEAKNAARRTCDISSPKIQDSCHLSNEDRMFDEELKAQIDRLAEWRRKGQAGGNKTCEKIPFLPTLLSAASSLGKPRLISAEQGSHKTLAAILIMASTVIGAPVLSVTVGLAVGLLVFGVGVVLVASLLVSANRSNLRPDRDYLGWPDRNSQ